MSSIKVLRAMLASTLFLWSSLLPAAQGSQATTSDGVSFSITLQRSSVTLHEPVYVQLTVENRLSEEVSLDLGLNRKANFEFVVDGPAGSTEIPRRLMGEGLARPGEVSLEPGAIFTQKLLANEWYEFSETGSYQIEVTLIDIALKTRSGHLILNEVRPSPMTLRIGARNEHAIMAVCQKLAEGARPSSDYEKRAQDAVALSFILDPAAIPYLVELARTAPFRGVAVLGLARIANVEGLGVIANFGVEDPALEASVRAALRNLELGIHVKD